MPLGTIAKLAPPPEESGVHTGAIEGSEKYSGMGYLRGENGQQVFFEHAAVPAAYVGFLKEGQEVSYELDAEHHGSQQRAKAIAPLTRK